MRDDQHLIDSDRIVGERSGRAHRLTDDHQQLNRHSGLVTERLKGGLGKGTPAVIGGAVDEAERDHPASHRLTEAGQGKSGAFQRLDDSNPANVALGQHARPVRLEDARFDQPGDVSRARRRPRLRFVLVETLSTARQRRPRSPIRIFGGSGQLVDDAPGVLESALGVGGAGADGGQSQPTRHRDGAHQMQGHAHHAVLIPGEAGIADPVEHVVGCEAGVTRSLEVIGGHVIAVSAFDPKAAGVRVEFAIGERSQA